MRSTTKLMKNWQFTGPDGKTTAVDLPHTWNNIDGQDGGNDYWREMCIRDRSWPVSPTNSCSALPIITIISRCSRCLLYTSRCV